MKLLASSYRAKHQTGFAAYMALQAALMRHYVRRGGTVQHWCACMAPIFHERYAQELLG
ncbi:MAG: hypothetical protein ACREIV_07420 [Planctomycetaceae bacterium]